MSNDEKYLDLLLTENIKLKAENTRLKELNKEMVAAFYRIIDLSQYGKPGDGGDHVREYCTAMIAKAGGEGE